MNAASYDQIWLSASILSDLIFDESLGTVLTISPGIFKETSTVDYTCFACYYAHSWQLQEGKI
jgi:hypothetical protein